MSPRTARRSRAPRAYATQEIDEDRQARAWRAMQEFQKLVPTFTSFARALTGNSAITVRAHPTQSATDGRVIHIAPPIALGDRMPHERMLCEKRDPNTKMKLCKSCATRELLMRRTYHEISHIIFNSLERPQKYLRHRIIQMINEWHPGDACDHQMTLLPQARNATTYLELAQSFSGYLLAILRSYEDARVDSKMYRVRPGLKASTEASLTHVFTQGVQQPDETIFWRDAMLEGQVTIGLLLLGLGIEPQEDWLSTEALIHLGDPELRRISERVLFANSAANAFEVAIDAFLHLQTAGILVIPKCKAIPPMPQPEPEENSRDADSEDGGSGSGNEEGSESDDETDSGDPDDSHGDESGEDGSGQSDSGTAKTESGPGADEPEGDESFENEDSTGSGDDQEDGDSASDADKAGASSDNQDEMSDRQEQGDDDLGNDDYSDDSPEKSTAKPGDTESSDDPGDLGSESSDPNEDDGSGNSDSADSESESDNDTAGGGGAAEGLDPSSDNGSDSLDGDSESKAVTGMEDGPVEHGTDSIGSDEDASESTEEGSAPPSEELKGEEVWEEENPETEVIAGKLLELLEAFHGHGDDERVDAELLGNELPSSWDKEADDIAIGMAVRQGPIFDTFSGTVSGLEVITYPDAPMHWGIVDPLDSRSKLHDPDDFAVEERIIGRTLRNARVIFSENKRAKHQRGLKSGRVNPAVLGRRAPVEDARLFQKKTRPGKRDYEVLIGVDVSGSTRNNSRLIRIKRAVFAQAELLNRLGIKFSIYAHTGGWDRNSPWSYAYGSRNQNYTVWLLKVKGIGEEWGLKTKTRLANLNPLIENLDGHTIEFYRKQLQGSRATDKILLYYTDGAMPAANHDEELDILQRELGELDRRGIIKLAVGINTDSPSRHGFDTVQVDSDDDLAKVVDQLGRYLS